MEIPKRFIRQSTMHTPRPKYIIIHNGLCGLDNKVIPKVELDYPNKFQYNYLKRLYIHENNMSDINYHFILDNIDHDSEILIGKPFHSPCMFEDIPDLYYYSIHIALMGNYNLDIANSRIYHTLAYRIITPLLYWFHLDKNCINLHYEVSTNKECDCPGSFFFKATLLDCISKYSAK